jgi:hypothetical protein
VPQRLPGWRKTRRTDSLFRLWLLLSALWIAGTIFFESLDGKMGEEVLETTLKCLPPLIPALIFRGLILILADQFRP